MRCYWWLRAPAGSLRAEPVVPDGCVEWIFHLADPFVEAQKGQRQPIALCVSSIERAVAIEPTGRVDLVAVRFQPGRAYPFFPLPLGEVSGANVDLEDMHIDARRWTEQLALADDAERIGLLDRWLTDRLVRAATDQRFDALAAMIERRSGDVAIDSVARLAGASNRQIERQFLGRVGIGPKRFARVLRFHRVVRGIHADPEGWLNGAMDGGFFDQSHLIREFRAFAGLTPGEYARARKALNAVFAGSAPGHL